MSISVPVLDVLRANSVALYYDKCAGNLTIAEHQLFLGNDVTYGLRLREAVYPSAKKFGLSQALDIPSFRGLKEYTAAEYDEIEACFVESHAPNKNFESKPQLWDPCYTTLHPTYLDEYRRFVFKGRYYYDVAMPRDGSLIPKGWTRFDCPWAGRCRDNTDGHFHIVAANYLDRMHIGEHVIAVPPPYEFSPVLKGYFRSLSLERFVLNGDDEVTRINAKCPASHEIMEYRLQGDLRVFFFPTARKAFEAIKEQNCPHYMSDVCRVPENFPWLFLASMGKSKGELKRLKSHINKVANEQMRIDPDQELYEFLGDLEQALVRVKTPDGRPFLDQYLGLLLARLTGGNPVIGYAKDEHGDPTKKIYFYK